MHRCLISPQQVRGSTVVLDEPRQVHHVARVLRARVGDPVACFDGQGAEYRGTIAEAGSRQVVVSIGERLARQDPRPWLWLIQAIPKGERFEWLIEKATELGVARVTPIMTTRTVVRISAQQASAKQARWQRIAEAACKQCDRATVPMIDAAGSLQDALAAVRQMPLAVIPTLEVATVPLADVLANAGRVAQVAALIGPEGDFSAEEVRLAEAHGARPVSLGPLTLRSDTAAVATLAILRHALGQ